MGGKLLIQFTICSLFILTYCILSYFTLWFCRTLVLITSVPGHCLSFTSDMLKGISLKTTNYFFISLITFLKQYNYINQLHHIKTQYLHM